MMKIIKYYTLLFVIIMGSTQLSAQNMDTIVVKGYSWTSGSFWAKLSPYSCNSYVFNSSYNRIIYPDSLTGNFQDTIIVPDSLSTGLIVTWAGTRAYDLSKSFNEVVFDGNTQNPWRYNPRIYSRGLNALFDHSLPYHISSSVTKIIWDLGDGTIDSAGINKVFNHTYSNPGSYVVNVSYYDSATSKVYTNDTIICIESNSNPCHDTIWHTTYWNNPRKISAGTGSYIPWGFFRVDWDFGDGNTYSGGTYNINHTYAQDGNYQICASYRDSLGCNYTICDSVSICALSFASNNPISTSNNQKTFTFSVALQGSPNVTYEWDFGDGSSVDTTSNPSHTFAVDSIYVVKVIVKSSTGCEIQATKTIDLSHCGFTASYTYGEYNGRNFVKEFVPVIDSTLQPDSIQWFVNGVSAGNANTFIYSHVNKPSGYYEVCMKVKKGYCSYEYCDSIYICGITNFFYYQMKGNDSINAQGMVYGIDSVNLSNYTYKWYVDGVLKQSGSSTNFSYKFPTSGSFPVCFEITPVDSGCDQKHCETIDVCKAYPNFWSAYNHDNDSLKLLINTPVAGYTYTWLINGDTVGTGSVFNTQITSDGDYEICSKVSPYNSLCPESYCQTRRICRAGDLDFSIIEHKEDSMSFELKDPHSAYTYTWTVNGDTVGTGTTFDHEFTSNGTFAICVNIDSDSVCTQKRCKYVYVCDINANYTITPGSGGSRNFNAITQDTNYTYKWIFGDGQVDTTSGSSANHTYSKSGQYFTKLIIYDHSAGCVDTAVRILNYNHPNGLCLSGNIILDSAGSTWLVDSAIVYLIEHDTSAGTLTALDSTYVYTADTNHYSFCGLNQGKYLIKAALLSGDPSYNNNIPTYYNYSTQWSGANEITAWHTMGGRNIYMVGGTNPGGPGFIGGLISAGANKTNNLDELIITILLQDNDGNTIDYRLLDASHEYSFNVPYGTYKVVVDIPGRTTEAYPVILSDANPTKDNVDFTVNSTNVALSLKEIPFTLKNNVYPNPASDVLNIDMSITGNQTITLELTDMQGRVVATATYNNVTGDVKLELNTAEVNSGIYILQIKTDNYSTMKKVVISK